MQIQEFVIQHYRIENQTLKKSRVSNNPEDGIAEDLTTATETEDEEQDTIRKQFSERSVEYDTFTEGIEKEDKTHEA